jgi:diaminopimelate decarboxylase
MGIRGKLKRILGPAARRLAPRRRDLPLAHWNLTRDAAGELKLSDLSLSDLATQYGSPLFVVDAQKLDANAAAFQQVPAGAQAGIECFYSYKTNPVPAVLERLHRRGVGAEVISEYELWLAQKLGVPGERIVMNGPGRTLAALRRGVEIGALVCINHMEEIAVVAQLARELGRRARVGLRVVPQAGWSNQFGEPIGASALLGYRDMLQRPELEVVALHAHLGAEIESEGQLARFVDELLSFCDELQAQLGFWPAILDVGGSLANATTTKLDARALRLNSALGFDLVPRDPASVIGIADYVSRLVSRVEAHCLKKRSPRPRIFAEPGRAMTSNTQLLLCQVMTLKHTGTPGVVHAVLDAGINIAEPMRAEYHQLFSLRTQQAREHSYRLVGPICTPMDTLAWCVRMPELTPGSRLAIMDTGAYFIPFSTSFSFPQPGLVMVDEGRSWIARRYETFDDLVRRDFL